jgi:hypothetical protein
MGRSSVNGDYGNGAGTAVRNHPSDKIYTFLVKRYDMHYGRHYKRLVVVVLVVI